MRASSSAFQDEESLPQSRRLGVRPSGSVSSAALISSSRMPRAWAARITATRRKPFDQVKVDLGHQDLAAVLVSVGASYDWVEGGRTHQAPEGVTLMSTLPGWQIHVPGHPSEVEVLLRRAMPHRDRVYFRLAADANAAPRPVRPFHSDVVRRGSASAPTVVAVGPMLDRVLGATAHLDATVLYCATVRPFDHRTLLAVAGSGEIAIVEPYLEGTSAHEISLAMEHRPHRLLSIGVPKAEPRRYGTRFDHDAANGLDAQGIKARVEHFLDVPVAAA